MQENFFFHQELTRQLKLMPGTNPETKKSQELIQLLESKSATKSSFSGTKLSTLPGNLRDPFFRSTANRGFLRWFGFCAGSSSHRDKIKHQKLGAFEIYRNLLFMARTG